MIFGIGLPRTGTRSLKQALRILGFRDVSGLTQYRRDFYQGRLALPAGKDAIVGGISGYYLALDKLYPGSKFILTIRDEDRWLNSVNNLWGVTYEPEESKVRLSWLWQHFGINAYHVDVLRVIYRSSKLGAIEYFANRPKDFLVLDIEQPQWPQLCGFLGLPIPDEPYPFEGKWKDEGQMDPNLRFHTAVKVS